MKRGVVLAGWGQVTQAKQEADDRVQDPLSSCCTQISIGAEVGLRVEFKKRSYTEAWA
jgi:hypothetical protein